MIVYGSKHSSNSAASGSSSRSMGEHLRSSGTSTGALMFLVSRHFHECFMNVTWTEKQRKM